VARSAYAKRFGQAIRDLRVVRKMSQEDLANAANLHPTHISLIESGSRSVRLETIERLAKALRVQPSKIMPTVAVVSRTSNS
jgi:transcriptional regulator with XRE-family HTH domain